MSSSGRLEAYRALPIPTWLCLQCPQCGYDLRGLPEHCCPECGLRFNIDELITPADPLRPPEITPDTRPVPEMGFTCDECEASLTGAAADRCPSCGERFDLEDYIPEEPWINLDLVCNQTELQLIWHQLRDDGIPCPFINGESAFGLSPWVFVVRRDYYLDALYLIFKNGSKSLTPWTCPNCGQNVPGNFEICWKCETPQPEEHPNSV